MEALLANMPLTPEQRAQIIARQQDLEKAAREEERRAGALQDQCARNLQKAPEVTALLKHSVANKSTLHMLRKDLNAAIEAIDAVDEEPYSQLVSDFREKLSDQLSIIGSGTGTASNKRKREVQHALEVFGVQVPPGGGGFDGGVVVVGELSDDDDDDDDEAEEAAAAAADGGVVAAPTEREQEPPAADAPLVVRKAFDLIMSSPTMRRSLRFTLAPFLLQIHRNVLAAQATAGTKIDGLLTMEETIKMFGGGRTQARKTPLKASAFVLCRMMGVPTLLLTTNVAGREDLFKKFSELLAEIDVPPPAGASPYAGTQYEYRKVHGVSKLFAVGRGDGAPGVKGVLSVESIANQHRDWAVSELRQGACIVSNNTAAAMNKLSGLVRQARGDRGAPLQFILTIDEADDFYRTDGEYNALIKLEQALLHLKGLGPLVCFEVSATLLAVYMALHREGGARAVGAADLWYVDPSDEYVGAELLMPPTDARGNYEFLSEHDLKKSNMLADEKVRRMYQDAADHPRSLLLDATTAAVTAGNQIGIFDKAVLVQKLHPHAVVVVVSGSLIKWWTVQPRRDRQQDYHGTILRGKDRVVGNVIAKIDRYYPDRPIFVFGYSQMVRGVSYRSRHRVPSHFVLMYKSGMPLCRLVQAAGRAMGEQARQLRANGFTDVLLLTQAQDYDVICAYPEFLKAIKREMEGGASLADALENRLYDPKCNVFSTPKELGAKKLKLTNFVQSTIQFASTTAPIGEGSAAIDRDLGTQGIGPRRAILEVLLECGVPDDDEYAMSGKEIGEELATGAYDDLFGDAADGAESASRIALSVPEVTKILKELCFKPPHRAAVLESTGAGKNLRFFIDQEGLDALPGREVLVAVPVAAADGEGDHVDVPMAMSAPPRRERSQTRRELELQAAEEPAGEDDEELRAARGAPGPSGASPQHAAAPVEPVATGGGRPRRGCAVTAAAAIAECSAQLQMGEDCDERPGDRIPAFGSAGPADVIVNGVTYIPKGSASPGKRKEPAHDDADKPNLKKANRG